MGMTGWQVLYLNKLELSKQHRDSSLSAGASEELSGIRDSFKESRGAIYNPSLPQISLIQTKHTQLASDVIQTRTLSYIKLSTSTTSPSIPPIHSE